MDLRQTLRLIPRGTAIAMFSGGAGVILTLALLTAAALDPFPIQHKPFSETSATALAVEPAPAYVSELAPAVMLAPEPAALPVSGVSADAGTPWQKATGLALALLGGLFIYAARAVRTEDTQ